MKVVNAHLAAKEGFTPGEMEAKIDTILDNCKKKAPVVTREDVELLEGAEQEEVRK